MRDKRIVVLGKGYIAATFDLYTGLLGLYWRIELRSYIKRQLVAICYIGSGLRVLKVGALEWREDACHSTFNVKTFGLWYDIFTVLLA